MRPDILTIALLGVRSAARGQSRGIVAFVHPRRRMQSKKNKLSQCDQRFSHYQIRHLMSFQIFPFLGVKCLKNQDPRVCMRRIRGCWMGTAYLAGLCAGTSQHNIPPTSLSLHVLGLIVRGGLFGELTLFLEP